MKKTIFFLSILFLPGFLFSQPYSNKDKTLIASRVDSLVYKFMQKSTLTDPGTNRQSLRVIKDFKNLFLEGAMIYDDINAEFKDDNSGFPYKLKEKTRNVYFEEVVEQFPKGLIINNKKVNINYDNLDKGIIKVALERNIAGTKLSGKYNLFNEDTLLIRIAVQKDLTVKISAVESLGNSLKVLNDKDLDGVIDPEDDCEDEKGKVSLKGCPDRDDDNIPDKSDDCPDQPGTVTNKGCPPSTFAYQFVFSGSAGYTFNLFSFNSTPQTKDLGYDDRIIDKARSNSEIRNPGYRGSTINLNAHIAYYYGKRKFARKKGVSLGFSYTNYTATYQAGGTKFVFQAFHDKSTNPEGYRKVRTLNEYSERNTFNIISFPLQYRVKGKLNTKLAWEIALGPAFNVIRTDAKVGSNSIDIEGTLLYKYDPGTDTYVPENPLSDIDGDSTYADVLIIREHISGQLNSPSPQILFDNLHERSSKYDFGIFDNEDPLKKVKVNTGLSINANADLFYHIKPKVAVKLGVCFVYAPDQLRIGNKGEINYYPSDQKTPDYYNPVLNSKTKRTYTSYGFNLGLVIGITTSKN